MIRLAVVLALCAARMVSPTVAGAGESEERPAATAASSVEELGALDPSENAPSADVYPHAGLSAEKAASVMTVPQGFSVVVAAAEPDVHQPIAMAYDDRGRLWVAEAYEYPRRAEAGQGRDRILIFEDRDGDGQFDDRKVFCEHLNLVSGLEIGFGGVWIGAAPELLFLADRNRDDVPDGPPQALLDGWGFHDTHETLNGFIWGPDGWLYGCHGVFTHSTVGKPGVADDQRVPLNAGIWRYHPTQHQFEVFAEGTSNPWGVDFNDHGHAFLTACVIPHLYHVIQGARYERQAGVHFNPYTYDAIKTIADHRHYVGDLWHASTNRSSSAGGGHAHSGAMIYLGGVWPAEYRNQIFMSNIHGQRLNMDVLIPRGSGYVGKHGPDFLLTGDLASQFVNLRYGPDGQVHVIDWYDRQACHTSDPQRVDRSNGRIYKIVYGTPAPFHGDLRQHSDEQLARFVLQPNDWYVRHARRILQERKIERNIDPGAVAYLRDTCLHHADETRRLRALWAWHVIEGAVDHEWYDAVLRDPHPAVRSWGIQLLAESKRPLPSIVHARWLELAKQDPSPLVRLYLAAALARLPLHDRWEMAAALSHHAIDATDPNLPLMVWYAIEPLVEADAARALSLGLSATSTMPLLRDYTVRRIAALPLPASRDLLLTRMRDVSIDTQRIMLKALLEAHDGQPVALPDAGWPLAYASLQQSDDALVRNYATALGVRWGDAAATQQARAAVFDRELPPDMRRLAAESLVAVQDAGLRKHAARLLEDPDLRGFVLRAMSAWNDRDLARQVVEQYGAWTTDDRRSAIGALITRPNLAELLLQAVKEGRVPLTDLSADVVGRLQELRTPEIDQLIASVWGSVRASSEDKDRLMAEYHRLVRDRRQADPDTSLGRAIFARTCQQCHTLYGTGNKIGPDLTGANRSDLSYLVTNIVDPSALVAKEYQPTVIETVDGRILTGLVREETGERVVLQSATEILAVPVREIERREVSPKSLMPDDQLKPFSPHEIRSLFAYLATRNQVPLLATKDHAPALFNGKDLMGWTGMAGVWSVEDGMIVGRSRDIAGESDPVTQLVRDIVVTDFRLSFDVRITPERADCGVQFRSQRRGADRVRGYQVDLCAPHWGRMVETEGRGVLTESMAAEAWHAGEWNHVTIEAEGGQLRTRLNGRLAAQTDDPNGATRGVFAFELDRSTPTELRVRNVQLTVLK